MRTGLSATTPDAMADAVMHVVRNAIWQALLIAAIAATFAGLLTSVLLSREILRPLQEIAESSERIAGGHYGQSVDIPYSDDLALVATNFNEMAESLEQVEQRHVQEVVGDVAVGVRAPLAGLAGYFEEFLDGLFPPKARHFAWCTQRSPPAPGR